MWNSNVNTWFSTLKEIENSQKSKKSPHYIYIKYRKNPVDISSFDTFNTSSSKIINWIWYDSSNLYLIINLNWVNYHYCLVLPYIWYNLRDSKSLYEDYQLTLKWKYDCRKGWIPDYDKNTIEKNKKGIEYINNLSKRIKTYRTDDGYEPVDDFQIEEPYEEQYMPE